MTGAAIHFASAVTSPNPYSRIRLTYRYMIFLASGGYRLWEQAIGVLPGLIATLIGSTCAGASFPSLIRSVSR